MGDERLKYYRFSYFVKTYGGYRKIFLSKQSLDFFLAVALTIIVAIGLQYYHPTIDYASYAAVAAIALLSLTLASYALILSLNDEEFLKNLIKSKNYQYLIFQLSWTTLWLSIALILGTIQIFLPVLDKSLILASITIFSLFYGFFGIMVTILKAVRTYAVMNGRRTRELKEAWDRDP